jgi:hypothetical protein
MKGGKPIRRSLLLGGLAAACLFAAMCYIMREGPHGHGSDELVIPTASNDQEPRLRVLYVGNPSSNRAVDFATFLSRHFGAVKISELVAFRESDADGFDVVIIDWSDEASQSAGPPPLVPAGFRLSDVYSRPTVLLGGAGGQIAGRSRLKFSWLCQCLGDAAHSISVGHEMFRHPSTITLDNEERPTPELFRRWPIGAEPPASFQMWKVQQHHAPEGDGFGLVCDPYEFEDSPDAEVIARGINSKNPRAIAIARQANFLLWGFSARPSAMTPSGQACFLNAIHYIRRFEGEHPLVRREANGREWAVVKAASLVNAGFQGTLRGVFPDALRDQFGHDLKRYVRYYQENIEFLRPSGEFFVMDEDVKRLDLSNRRIELLDRCVAMLERNEEPDLAYRVLKRYTTEDFDDHSGWRRWLESNRARLYFSDVGGYRFRVSPVGRVVGAMTSPDNWPYCK